MVLSILMFNFFVLGCACCLQIFSFVSPTLFLNKRKRNRSGEYFFWWRIFAVLYFLVKIKWTIFIYF